MPKRKKLPPMPEYISCGENSEKLLIQKSNPLLSLSGTSMTLTELKILDVYLSRINSHEPEKRLVRFEKGELEKLLGNTCMRKDDLVKRLKNLLQAVEIVDERYPKKANIVVLFEKALCEQDEDGLWQVDLMCTPSAMEYIFNIENLGYLKYRLKSVINLTSRYSYILYLFLSDYFSQGLVKIPLDDLKQMLNCNAERYNEFKFFNFEILKKCQNEINKKTDIFYTYSTIRKGRKIATIGFEISRNPNAEPYINSENLSIPEETMKPELPEPEELPVDKDQYNSYESDYIFQCATIFRYEFSNEQMKEICNVVSEIDLPVSGTGRIFDEYDFLYEMYHKLCKYTDGVGMNTKRRFAYLMKMLKSYRAEHSVKSRHYRAS